MPITVSGSLGNKVDAGKIGILKSLNLGGPVVFVSGIFEELTDGSPAAPSMRIDIPNSWRFRWVVRTGTHTIQVNTKQVVNLSPRPSLIVRSNPSIGIPSDITAVAPGGTGWVTVGPITVNPTSTGAVFVDMVNNCIGQTNTPAYFDHIVTT